LLKVDFSLQFPSIFVSNAYYSITSYLSFWFSDILHKRSVTSVDAIDEVHQKFGILELSHVDVFLFLLL